MLRRTPTGAPETLSAVSKDVGRNDACPCGSGVKYKRCCQGTSADLLLVEDRRQGQPGRQHDRSSLAREPDLTVLVPTPGGTMARLIPSASPLPPLLHYGTAAESATHDAAALWGLPDFVFLPETADVGSGRRELGDGIVLVRRHGVVLQVKGRETPSSDEARERAWFEKKSAQALRQGNGTIRTLQSRPFQMMNLRHNDTDRRQRLRVDERRSPRPSRSTGERDARA
jgi:hypothetical protein